MKKTLIATMFAALPCASFAAPALTFNADGSFKIVADTATLPPAVIQYPDAPTRKPQIATPVSPVSQAALTTPISPPVQIKTAPATTDPDSIFIESSTDIPNFIGYPFETYKQSIERWVQQEASTIIWDVDAEALAKLNEKPANQLKMHGNLYSALSQVAHNQGVNLAMTLDPIEKVAAIHQHVSPTKILEVGGGTLIEAIDRLGQQFGYTLSRSNWRTALEFDVYRAPEPWYIVSPVFDFGNALGQLIDGYPYAIELVNGSKTFYITEL